MKYVHRGLEKQVAQAIRHFPALVLTGLRRAGKTMLLRRGYPEVVARPGGARLWLASYLQTYLERDGRAVTAVRWGWWNVRPDAPSRRRWPRRCSGWPKRRNGNAGRRRTSRCSWSTRNRQP